MNIVYIENPQKITLKDEQLVFSNEDGEVILNHHDVSVIIIDNMQTSISIPTLLKLDQCDILCIICDQKHQPILTLTNQYAYYQLTYRLKQQITWSEEVKAETAKLIIYNKIYQQQRLLNTLQFSRYNVFEELLYKVDNSEHIHHQEALAARMYFKLLFGSMFKRFQNDIANQALNYTYMILSAMIAQTLIAKGLHPALGFIHYSKFNNYNLVFDIIEAYRPLADRHVFQGLKKFSRLDKSFKKYLLTILHSDIIIESNTISIRKSVELFIDSIIKFCQGEGTITFPKVFY